MCGHVVGGYGSGGWLLDGFEVAVDRCWAWVHTRLVMVVVVVVVCRSLLSMLQPTCGCDGTVVQYALGMVAAAACSGQLCTYAC